MVVAFQRYTPSVPLLREPEQSNVCKFEAVKTMNVETRLDRTGHLSLDAPSVDPALRGGRGEAVPVDLIMVAVGNVHGYVYSRLARIGRAGDVEDVLQDIRLAVWEALVRGRYRPLPGVPFEGWVQGITNNICAAWIRREVARSTVEPAPNPETGEVPAWESWITAVPGTGIDGTARQALDGEEARRVLVLIRRNVSDHVWALAVDGLT
ncbi:MAG: hypothetical protein JWP57_4049, partial [Spirosoma sp.]|nr:hypothetical protein [Spirosoma sp.]